MTFDHSGHIAIKPRASSYATLQPATTAHTGFPSKSSQRPLCTPRDLVWGVKLLRTWG